MQNLPVHILYLFNFILLDIPGKRWIYQTLRVVTVVLHTVGLVTVALFMGSQGAHLVNETTKGLLSFWLTLVAYLSKFVLMLLFIWKSCHKKQMHKFLADLGYFSAKNPLTASHTVGILAATAASCALCLSNLFYFIMYIMPGMPATTEMFVWMRSDHLRTFVIHSQAVQTLYVSLFSYLFCPFNAWVCLHISHFLQNLKASLSEKIRTEEIYQEETFHKIYEKFREIERLGCSFTNLFALDVVCFMGICVDDLIFSFYTYVAMGKCGFPTTTLKIFMGITVSNFLLFVIPCSHLYSQVSVHCTSLFFLKPNESTIQHASLQQKTPPGKLALNFFQNFWNFVVCRVKP